MAETAYEQTSREVAESRSGLPRIPAGHFRVHSKVGTLMCPFPFKDIPNDRIIQEFFETRERNGEVLEIVQNVREVLARTLWEGKAKKLKSKILSIEDGPGKAGRPKGEGEAKGDGK